jgi:hypothetical protein
VQRLVIVFGILHLTNRCSKVTTGSLGRDDESDLARWVGGDGSVSVLGGGENGRSHGSELLDKREVDPKSLALGRNVSSRSESIVEKLEVGLLEERLGRADGVRGVGGNDVVSGFVVGKEFEAVADEDSYTRVVEEVGHVGEVFLGYTDDGLGLR